MPAERPRPASGVFVLSARVRLSPLVVEISRKPVVPLIDADTFERAFSSAAMSAALSPSSIVIVVAPALPT